MQDMTLLFDDYAIICKNGEFEQVIFDGGKQVNVVIWDRVVPIEEMKNVNQIKSGINFDLEIKSYKKNEEEIRIRYNA